MDSEGVQRRLAAILSADVVGYTRLMAADEVSTVRALSAHHETISRLVSEHGGRVVDAPGDNLLAEFPSATEAVRCAADVQRAVRVANADVDEERRMEFRIGVHSGEIMVEGERIYGDGVNIAARLEGLAQPGGVTISGEVHAQVRGKVDLDFEDLGARSVKNLPDPVHVFEVRTGSSRRAARVPAGRTGRRIALGAAGAIVLALLAGLGWRVLAPLGEGSAGRPIRSLAVLPLDNLSGDPSQEYFADGMTEALIANLAKIGALRVISRTSVMQFKGTRTPLREIAERLDVDAVVEGSVLRDGQRVRITAQLIDAATDEHLWAESYERELGDVIGLQREVARAIASEVEVALTPQQEQQLEAAPRVDPAALEAYLRGRFYWNKRTEDGLRRGLEYMQQAIALDPDYADAHSGLADAYIIQASFGGSLPPRELMPLAKRAAERALELDESLAQAHASLAAVHLWYDWDWPASEASFRRALELEPGSVWGRFWYADYLTTMGRDLESVRETRRAREVDPLSPLINVVLGNYLHFSGSPEAGRAQIIEALEMAPDFVWGYNFLADLYAHVDRYDEALAAVEEAVKRAPGDVSVRTMRAKILARSGRRDEARAALAELTALREQHYIPASHIAVVHAALGDDDAAFAWLDVAYEERDRLILGVLLQVPVPGLDQDPRFDALARRLGLPCAAVACRS